MQDVAEGADGDAFGIQCVLLGEIEHLAQLSHLAIERHNASLEGRDVLIRVRRVRQLPLATRVKVVLLSLPRVRLVNARRGPGSDGLGRAIVAFGAEARVGIVRYVVLQLRSFKSGRRFGRRAFRRLRGSFQAAAAAAAASLVRLT